MTPKGRAAVIAAVIASNKRRGEQNPEIRERKRIFNQQRGNARRRRIEWHLTFNDWWAIWDFSGHWAQRGRKRGQFAMCRFGDVGTYEVGNVFIGRAEENVSAAHLGRAKPAEQRAKMSASAARRPRAVDGTFVS